MYDLIIIGGGPAGYLAAERAGHAKLSTLLIEKRQVGGVCLNEGCIPSKALLHSAKVYDYATHGAAYGVTTTGAAIDHAAVVARKNKVVNTLVAGVKSQLKHANVTVIAGEAMIEGQSNEGYRVSANGETHEGARLLIATGSMPIVPPIPGVKEGLEAGLVLTNREILDLPAIPEKLVVIGCGVIGLEMASYFNSVGANVVVIEMLDHIAGQTDDQIGKILQKNYEKKGITFKLGCKVTQVGPEGVTYEAADGTAAIQAADKVLLSIGRRAVTSGIGLETIGVELDRGAVKTDLQGRTNVLNVYAAGDVNGKSMLAHTAYREAEVCINTMLGKKDVMRYNAIPAVIYTNPEVGSVGETEDTCKQKGIAYEVANLPMMYAGRYVAENSVTDGICKVIVDKAHRKLIGCHIIGSYASEIIVSAGIMIEQEMRVDDIKEIVFPHPTVSEIIREGIFQL